MACETASKPCSGSAPAGAAEDLAARARCFFSARFPGRGPLGSTAVFATEATLESGGISTGTSGPSALNGASGSHSSCESSPKSSATVHSSGSSSGGGPRTGGLAVDGTSSSGRSPAFLRISRKRARHSGVCVPKPFVHASQPSVLPYSAIRLAVILNRQRPGAWPPEGAAADTSSSNGKGMEGGGASGSGSDEIL